MSDINNCAEDLITYLAAELERAAREHRFAAADLEAVRMALKGGLITPHQAIMHVEETDAFRFLGRRPGDNWGAEWAQSALQYDEDRKRSVRGPKVSR
jgi:hypothetical protein